MAKLSNCTEIEESSGYKRTTKGPVKLDDGKTYVRRRGCDWQPYGPVHEFTVSRQMIRSSDEYKNIAHRGPTIPNAFTRRPVLRIYFTYTDDGFSVDLIEGKTGGL